MNQLGGQTEDEYKNEKEYKTGKAWALYGTDTRGNEENFL